MQRFSNHLLLACLLAPGLTDAQTKQNINTKKMEVLMTTIQTNKEVIRKLYDQSLNKRNTGLLQQFVHEDYIGIGGLKGPAGFEEPIGPLMKGFPDIQWNIEELIGEDDKVVVKWKLQGTHTNEFTNFEATGNRISNEGMAIFELKNGKIINSYVQTDRLGFLQELHVLPRDINLLKTKKNSTDHVSFIDKFFVPSHATKEFYERMHINRNFIKTLPGFLEDAAYEYTDNDGNLICITIALWESIEALNKAKEAVLEENRKQGVDIAAMLKRLKIVTDRGVYKETVDR